MGETAVVADWPAFRGPAGNGIAATARPPVRWSDTENVTWKVSLAGEGWSSPVLADDLVLVTVAVPLSPGAKATDYSLRLFGVDAKTGSTRIDMEVFRENQAEAAKIHSKNSHASPTPLVDGNRVYVHFGHEGTACVDLSGRILWQNRTLRYKPVHGAGGTPILVDGRLIFSCDGAADPFVVALDADTGKVVWRVPRNIKVAKAFSFATATLAEVAGQKQVISPGSGGVMALDPATGAELWRVRYGEGYSVIPKPVIGNGMVYVCSGYDKPKLLAIRLGGRGDVTDTHVAWTIERSIPHTPSLLLNGEDLFLVADNGVATCLDATTGEQIWQKRLGGNYSASPLYANGLVYFQSEQGTTIVIRAAREYEVVATNEIGQRTLASFAVDQGALFLRSDKHLYRIEER